MFKVSWSDLDRSMRIRRLDRLSDSLEVPLCATGVSIKLHEKIANSLLVGQSNGIIKLYDMSKDQFVLSVYQPGYLRSLAWNAADPNVFAATIGSNWFVWNLAALTPTLPEHSGIADSSGANIVLYACLTEMVC